MPTPIAYPQVLVLLSVAVYVSAAAAAGEKTADGTAEAASPGATINSNAAERRKRELEARAYRALVSQALTTASDLQSACAGGPRRPKLVLKGRGELLSLGSAPGYIGISKGNGVSGNLACEPHWDHLLYSAAHALLAARSWAASNPQQAHLVRIKPESPNELKQLQMGLANVMSAFETPVKP